MKTKPSELPVNIELPENTLLEDGTLFVRLRTLDELESFWSRYRKKFSFACEGKSAKRPIFLREYEWVFGPKKAAVMRTVMRWGQSGIGCEFYDWANNDPRIYEMFFLDRDADRKDMITKGKWSEEDEADFLADCTRRSPETYRGWWRYCNLPNVYGLNGWFNGGQGHEELIDPQMAYIEVATTLQEQTFEDWRRSDFWELESHDNESIEETIRYWKNERAKGEGYYGDENEPSERHA